MRAWPVPRLSDKERKQLERILLKGPRKRGYRTELWTLPRIAEVIQPRFGVAYDPSSVWHILRKMDWSCQKPERRARERDEERIVRWRKQDWPRIKKARRSGCSIVLIDESGFDHSGARANRAGPAGPERQTIGLQSSD